MAHYPSQNGSEAAQIKRGAPKPLAELMNPGAIEIETFESMDSTELEKFMNETVVIYVHPTRESGALDVITPNCNGINQPIIRGVETPVKRKYVEPLARCHTVKYEQRVQNPSQPENIQMIEKKVPDYPFDVINDTRKGKDWLKSIYNSL